MPHQENNFHADGDDADLAQAFRELARGEQTAAALESQLDTLESKIEALLASATQNQKDLEQASASDSKSKTTNGSSSTSNKDTEGRNR